MTNFSTIPISSIYIDRENRQRKDLTDIDKLAASIAETGLINPIVVTQTPDGIKLIAGERRLTAHKHLGLEEITVQFFSDLDPIQQHLLELEENVQRVDLTWQDEVEAVSAYHELRRKLEPSWNIERTAEALRIDPSYVSRQLLVKRNIDEGVEEVIAAPKFSTACNFAQRREERRKTMAKRDLLSDLTGPAEESPDDYLPDAEEAEPSSPTPKRHCNIEQADFTIWSQQVLDEPYNFLHVDFPYGVNAGNTSGQSAAKNFGGYADTKDVYDTLLTSFVKNLDNFCAPSAHMMFWFSMDYYEETRLVLKESGWRVDPFPLIWFKSDNTGILPDANRGPRRVYETAFFCTRGDRKIVKAVGNAVGAGTPSKEDKIHMSQKSRPMLEHFFRMIVDESTRMLDPTAGSAEAVAVAEAAGASYSLGLELNPDYVTDARAKLGLD